MSRVVTLHFPFKLDGYEYKAEYTTDVLRKENIVIFSIGFSGFITVNSEKAYKVFYVRIEGTNQHRISIEFSSINDAISFHTEPIIHLSHREIDELEPVDKKLEEVIHLLESTGSSWKKRRAHSEPDEDGFVTV